MQLINKKSAQQSDKVDKAVETTYNPQLMQSYSDKNLITRSHKMRTQLLKQMLFEEKVIEKNLNLLFKSSNGLRLQKTQQQNTKSFKKQKDTDIPILMLMEKLKNMQEKQLLNRMKKQSSNSTKVKLTESQRLKMLHKNLKNMDLYGQLSSSQMFKS